MGLETGASNGKFARHAGASTARGAPHGHGYAFDGVLEFHGDIVDATGALSLVNSEHKIMRKNHQPSSRLTGFQKARLSALVALTTLASCVDCSGCPPLHSARF